MADIPALKELVRASDRLKNLPKPPAKLSQVEGYQKQQKQIFEEAANIVENVGKYAELILNKIDELKLMIPAQIKTIQQAIEDIMRSIQVSSERVSSFQSNVTPRTNVQARSDQVTGHVQRNQATPVVRDMQNVRNYDSITPKNTTDNHNQSAIDQMKTMHALEEVAKGIVLDRLNELIHNTENMLDKVKKGGNVTQNDMDDLKGCLDSWTNAKQMSHETEKEQKRLQEENKRVMAAELKRQEAEKKLHEKELKKQQDDLKRQRKEEERKARLEQERKQREADMERKRADEERKKRKEEELRRQREEEKRWKRQEEERLARSEKEHKQMDKEELDEARRKAEQERKQREIEKKRAAEERKLLEEQKRLESEVRKREKEEKMRQEKARRKQQEEEKRAREEEERRTREDEERRKREQEEKQQREEEERRKQKEQEIRQREKEQKRKQEEEKKRQQEEEERRKRDEEEKQQREEEERRKQEEEKCRKKEERRKMDEEAERKKKEEEQIRKSEEEKQRRLKEEADLERKRQEDEERAIRLDPNNWKPIAFERPCDEVGGKRPFHDGICCMVTSPLDGITEDSIQCTASDEIDDIIEKLEEDEKPASSIINVQTKSKSISTECPSRVFLPHYPCTSSSEELIVKYSINGSDWTTSEVVRPSQCLEDYKKFPATNLVGLEANGFDTLKMFVVSRQIGQSVTVEKEGLTVVSTTDQNVKLIIPSDAFSSRTRVRLTVEKKALDMETNCGLMSDKTYVGPMATVVCDNAPVKNIALDIENIATPESTRKLQRGKRHHLLLSPNNGWSFAECDYKEANTVVGSIILPANRLRYTIVEVELPINTPKENALKLAQTYHAQSLGTPVHVVLKQQKTNPENANLVVVQPHALMEQLERLKNDGFTLGPDPSKLLSVREGQRLYMSSRGNIDISGAENGTVRYTFFKYIKEVNANVKLKPRDAYLQRDLPEYNGILLISEDNDREFSDKTIEFTVHLPKADAPKGRRAVHRIRFPYYLTCLAGYLSKCICESQNDNWQDIVSCFIDKKQLQSLIRVAKRRVREIDQRTLCRNVLHDWMKQTTKQEDKVQIILEGLQIHQHVDIHRQCEQFVVFQKGTMTDRAIADIAASVTRSPDDLASVLNIQPEVLHTIKTDYEGVDVVLQILTEWRESDDAINLGNGALDELKGFVCS